MKETQNHIKSVVDGYLSSSSGTPGLFALNDKANNAQKDEEVDVMSVAKIMVAWCRINKSKILHDDIRTNLRSITLGPRAIQELALCFNESKYDLSSVSTLLLFLNKHLTMTPTESKQIELSQVAQAFAPLFFDASEEGILLTAIIITHMNTILPHFGQFGFVGQHPPSSSPLSSPSISPLQLSKIEECTTPSSPLPNPFASRQAFSDELWTSNELVDLRSLVDLSVSSCLFDEELEEQATGTSLILFETCEDRQVATILDDTKSKASDEVFCTVTVSSSNSPLYARAKRGN